MRDTPAIVLDGVGHVFEPARGRDSVRALVDVGLRIDSGEFFAVIGPSGCGKSTLLDIITGVTAPTEGRVFFEGTEIRAQGIQL